MIGTLQDAGLQGFVWSNCSVTRLELDGGSPYAINRAGQIVGYDWTVPSNPIQDAYEHAFSWRKGVLTTLGTLGGLEADANGINTAGQIVGSSNVPNGKTHAFVYTNGVMTDLGTLGGGTSIANDINAAGWIVGVSSTKAGASRATLWKPK